VTESALLGPVLKLNRAEEHVHAIKDLVDEFARSDFYESVSQPHRKERGVLVVRARNVRPPPPEISLLIGECVFNFRSALDQIAFAMASANTTPLPKSFAKSSAFPIFNNGPQYRGRGGPPASRKIRGMSRQGQAAIERLQPYHRRKNPRLRALWRLEELSNIDKHRLIHTTGAMGVRSRFKVGGPGFRRITGIEPVFGPVTENAIVGRVFGDFDFEAGVDVQAEIQADIAFDRRSEGKSFRGRSVMMTLLWIRECIVLDVLREVQPEFQRLFPGSGWVIEGDLPDLADVAVKPTP
jgi:hypothetical protein